MRSGGVVLAAGAGSRFGGGKLTALLDGRPLVRHVLDAAVAAGLDPIVVVVPPDGSLDRLDLRPARRVVNPEPSLGQSGSVRLGLAALGRPGATSAGGPVEAAVILPGDQPLVRPAVIERLLAAADETAEPLLLAPLYAGDAAPNPILARREAWRLADELVGDRGFGPLLEDRPDLVRRIAVEGTNPDVDTRDDLARLTEAVGGTSGPVARGSDASAAEPSGEPGPGPGDVP